MKKNINNTIYMESEKQNKCKSKNKTQVSEYNKQYYEDNKQVLKNKKKTNTKKWREKNINKHRISEYNKRYYKEHKINKDKPKKSNEIKKDDILCQTIESKEL